MLRRIVRSALNSRVFAFLTQSKLGWSILGRFPRSFRYDAKDFFRRAYDTPLDIPSELAPHIEPWQTDTPLLSLIIPCYNYGQYLGEALQSIRSQTFQDFEIIVVDDGSTDILTLRALEQLREEGIRVLHQQHAPGPAQALNRGISAAVGKYICCINSDDTIEPTYLEKCLLLLESNPGVSIAYSLIRTFGTEHRTGLTQPFNLRLLLAYNHVSAAAVYRREAWNAVGGYDESMPAYEDWDFWIRLGKAGFRGRLIDEPLFNWRRHRQSLGSRVDKIRPELLAKIRSNHNDIFANPERIVKIQRSYRDYRVPNPFVNLNSKTEYRNLGVPTLLIASSKMPQSCGKTFYDFLSRLKERPRSHLLAVIAGACSHELENALEKLTPYVYNLPGLLDNCYWRSFMINLIRTRGVGLVLISDPILAREWESAIRECSEAAIVDLSGST